METFRGVVPLVLSSELSPLSSPLRRSSFSKHRSVAAVAAAAVAIDPEPHRACYGPKHVEVVHEQMAVQTLLITDELFRGEYGIWTAFLALLVHLFFFMPGELELPLVALLMAIVAPYQVMSLRGKQEGAIISLAIAAYMAYRHFSCTGSQNQSFDQGSIVATLAIICIGFMSCFLLFRVYCKVIKR